MRSSHIIGLDNFDLMNRRYEIGMNQMRSKYCERRVIYRFTLSYKYGLFRYTFNHCRNDYSIRWRQMNAVKKCDKLHAIIIQLKSSIDFTYRQATYSIKVAVNNEEVWRELMAGIGMNCSAFAFFHFRMAKLGFDQIKAALRSLITSSVKRFEIEDILQFCTVALNYVKRSRSLLNWVNARISFV